MFAKRWATAIKNNPKKSIVAVVVGGIAGNWINNKYKAHVFRRVNCENAKNYGNEPLYHLKSPKRLTVFLNPAANNGKATKMYEDYAEPILQLAGFDVHVVKLRYEGEAKKLMSVLDDTDMILVAGGDGTLNEIANGLFRRPDKMWRNVPIGIIPLGTNNIMCKRLFGDAQQKHHAQFICQAATSIITGVTCPVDVMQIKASTGETVYALSDIKWGTYSDLQEKIKKYWYFWKLKSYVPFLFAPLKNNWPPATSFSVSYTEPEDTPVPANETDNSIQNTISMSSILNKIFSHLWPWSESSEAKGIGVIKEVEKEVIEPEWNNFPIESAEFVASINTHLNSSSREKPSIKIMFDSSEVSYSDFVRKGPHTMQGTKHTPVNLTKDIEAHKFKLSSDSETKSGFFSIDNERYEAKDIDAQLIPNCIQMICSK